MKPADNKHRHHQHHQHSHPDHANVRDSQFLPSDSEDESDGFRDSIDEESPVYSDHQERRPLLNKNDNNPSPPVDVDGEMDSFEWNWSTIYRYYNDYAPLMRLQRSIPYLNRFSPTAICWLIIPFKVLFWVFVGYLILSGGDVSRYSSHIPGWYAADNTVNTETDDLITTTTTDGILKQVEDVAWSKDSLHPIHGDLWERVRELSAIAKDNGALQTIAVSSESQRDQGMEFVIFKPVDESSGKSKTMIKSKVSDPLALENIEDSLIIHRFANNERSSAAKSENMFAYSIVLNKFNTVPHHCLLVSDKFESQIHPITMVEFGLWFYSLFNGNSKSGSRGVGFYNSDAISGASQKHKHLQLLPVESVQGLRKEGAHYPMPLDDEVLPLREKLPVFPVQSSHSEFAANKFLHKLSVFPFQHGFALLDTPWMTAQLSKGAIAAVAEYLQNVYSFLLHYNHIDQSVLYNCAVGTASEKKCQASSHNVILTESYMFVIPRVKPAEQLNINAMGFLGLLLTHEPERSDVLRVKGPMAVLSAVTRTLEK